MNTGTTTSYHAGRRERHSKLTRKGQVTVPFDVRNVLDLKEGDKVAFILDKDKRVQFIKKGSVVAQTAGAIKTSTPSLAAKRLREETERAIGEEVMERST